MITIRPLPRLERELAHALISGYTSAHRYAVTTDFAWDHLVFAGNLVPCDPPFVKAYLPPRAEDLVRYDALAAGGHVFGAFDDARGIGLAISEPVAWNQSLTLWELHVAPEWRRQGVGRALVEAVLRHARAQGLCRVRLETQTTNAPAIRFYTAQGFAVVGLDTGLYAATDTAPGEFALYMQVDLVE